MGMMNQFIITYAPSGETEISHDIHWLSMGLIDKV